MSIGTYETHSSPHVSVPGGTTYHILAYGEWTSMLYPTPSSSIQNAEWIRGPSRDQSISNVPLGWIVPS